MSVEDEQFEQLLMAFESAHAQRTRSLEAHMNKAKSILESETDGLQQTINVKHAPISARLKDADKALRTLRRRQEDRKQLRKLKTLVNEREQKWEEYCKEWSMEDKINEAEPFTSVEQMFEAMHDLAGIRISVYFPTDIPKVVEFLKGPHFKIIGKPNRKGGLTRDFQKVRKLVERQRQMPAVSEGEDTERMETIGSTPELTFAGYKATHVVIQLSDLDFDKHSRGDSITNIEVQIGSIVMHAWSDIEHDILYKPSENEEASADVVQMLDLINGIVMTGEVALHQLSRVAAAETTRLAANRTRPADNWHHVVTWFYTYFKDRRIDVPPDIDWSVQNFSPLFEVLRATNEHNYGRVEALLDQTFPQPRPEVCLPLNLLHNLRFNWFDDPSFKPPRFATTWSARYWATCLVNTVNLGLYLGCSVLRPMETHSSKNKTTYTKRPTFAEFVDIVHPTKPQRQSHRDMVMIDFCKHALATNFDHDPAALAAVKLAAAGYVVRPRLSKDEEKDLGNPSPTFVPAMLKYLTRDTDSSFDIALSLIGDDVYYDKGQYFIPRKEGNTWKPVRREAGKGWVITKHPFTNDEKLIFKPPKDWKFFTEHLCNVLGITTDSGEIRALRDLAHALIIVDDIGKLRNLNKVTSALGTKNVNKIGQFMQMSEKLKDSKPGWLVELAELSRALNTMNADELKVYRYLAFSHSTTDADELRALKRLAGSHGTYDPRQLRELRSREKDAEEFSDPEQTGANEVPARLDSSWGSGTPRRRSSPMPVREIAQGGWRSHDSVQYRP